MENLAHLDPRDLEAKTELMDHPEEVVPLVNKDPVDSVDPLDHLVLLDDPDLKAPEERVVDLANPVQWDHLDNKVPLDYLDPLEILAPLVYLEKMDPVDSQVRLDNLVALVMMVNPALLVWMD